MTLAERIGRRMKQAAEDSGLSAREIQRRLGYTGSSTLHRWFAGQSQPTFYDFFAFGQIVGKPFSWFFQIDEEADDTAAFVVDTVVSVLFRLLSGEDPADALAGELGDPAAVSPHFRRLLEESAEAAREELNSLAGGFLDLAPAEQRRRLRRIVNSYLDPEAV